MNIFISHSSRQRWIAQQIKARLESYGANAFCHESDVELGAIIEETVWETMRNADEVLVLLTPAALQARWVSMEIGAAQVAKKKLRIVRMDLTHDDIPIALTGGRSTIDLNDIEQYFKEMFKETKVNEVRRFVVADAPSEELSKSDLGKVDYADANRDDVTELIRRVFEAAYEDLKRRRAGDDDSR